MTLLKETNLKNHSSEKETTEKGNSENTILIKDNYENEKKPEKYNSEKETSGKYNSDEEKL